MNKEQFISELGRQRIYDAHTHLIGSKLCAADFWEIVHYFWFLRELQGAGYPVNYDSLPEDKRIEAFLQAYSKTKGTGMHYAVKCIFRDLYGLELKDKNSVISAIEKVKASSSDGGWAKQVTGKANVNKIVVNEAEHLDFTGLDGVSVWLPRIDAQLSGAAQRIIEAEAGKRKEAAERERKGLLDHLSELHGKGAKAIMTTLGTFNKKTWRENGESFSDIDDCYVYLLHAFCAFAESKRINIQFFLGVEYNKYFGDAAPVNNNNRILNLYGLFEKYKINFDLVVASEANNMDVVQAAHIFSNVYVGGMWWFNFRPSTYMDAMAKRFETLASVKTYLSISDSRCIEWCYGKNTLIKKLAGDFFSTKVDEGFISYEDALEIAEDWFYATPRALYG
jgi:glucuronate isomerase